MRACCVSAKECLLLDRLDVGDYLCPATLVAGVWSIETEALDDIAIALGEFGCDCLWFANNGKSEIYCSSADWLERNLLRRVETCFPVIEPELAQRVFTEELEYYLRDNCQSWMLNADGSYRKVIQAESEPAFCAQARLLSDLSRKR